MLNQISLMGRLTRDPELRYTQSGTPVASFSLAVDRDFASKESGERQTDFIDIVAWRNTADFICRYFKKGQMMAVSGSIQMRTYTDKEGKNRKAFEVLADNVYFTESKNPNATSSGSYEQRADLPAAEEPNFSAGDNDDFAVIDNDEDLPF